MASGVAGPVHQSLVGPGDECVPTRELASRRVQVDALSELRIAFQVLGGVKSVAFDGPPAPDRQSGTYAAVGVGTTWTVPVTPKVGIRVFDLNWFATPGDSLSTHRFSLAFGVDIFPFEYFGR